MPYLVTAAASTGLAALLAGQDFSGENLMQMFLTVGAPAMLGQAVVKAVQGDKAPRTSGEKLLAAAAGGGVAVALMIASGALPATVDGETLTLVALIGAGVYVGEFVYKSQ